MKKDLDILIEKKKLLRSLNDWNMDKTEEWTKANLMNFIRMFIGPGERGIMLVLEDNDDLFLNLVDRRKYMMFELTYDGSFWKTLASDTERKEAPWEFSASLFFSYLQAGMHKMFNLRLSKDEKHTSEFTREVEELMKNEE